MSVEPESAEVVRIYSRHGRRRLPLWYVPVWYSARIVSSPHREPATIHRTPERRRYLWCERLGSAQRERDLQHLIETLEFGGWEHRGVSDHGHIELIRTVNHQHAGAA